MTISDGFCLHCRLPVPPGEPFCCAGCRIAAAVVGGQGERGESASLLIRLAVGVFLAMFVKSIAWIIYASEPGAIPPELAAALSWIMFAASAPVLLLLGAPYFAGAVREALALRPATDLLISLAAVAGLAASVAGLFTGGQVWFDTVCMILVLTTVGRLLEASARAAAREHLSALIEPFAPTAARIAADGAEREVPAAELAPGDLIRVRPGGAIPADGIVVSGAAAVEQAALTGESAPVERTTGDEVLAGAIARDGTLLVRVSRSGKHTVRGRLAELVRQTLLARGRTQRLVDHVSAVFVLITLLLSAATFLYWRDRPDAGPDSALLNALAVVLVACPCALGLATPLATVAGVGAALRRGVLVRDADVLERLAGVNCVVFDKTGTLTDGRFAVREFRPLDDTDPATALTVAAALESACGHPIARAVREFAEGRREGVAGAERSVPRSIDTGRGIAGTGGLPASAESSEPRTSIRAPQSEVLSAPGARPQTTGTGGQAASGAQTAPSSPSVGLLDFRAHPGGGATGVVELDGRRLAAGIGTLELFRRLTTVETADAPLTPNLSGLRPERFGPLPQGERADAACSSPAPASAVTLALLWWDDLPRAVFTLGDRLRPEAEAAVAELRALGVRIEMLTGDRTQAAEPIAAALSLDAFRAGLSPTGKQEHVAALRAAGNRVAFVGDGINDGPALAAADVGVAPAAGTDLARRAADVSLLGADLRAAPWAIGLSRAVRRTVRGNLFWAFAYNVVGLWAASAGLLTPGWAALAMAAGSLCVVGNSLRLRRLGEARGGNGTARPMRTRHAAANPGTPDGVARVPANS